MSQEVEWNDESRANLRETLRWYVRGHSRLMKLDQEAILNACREVFLVDECPSGERETFVQFAADELSQCHAQVESEQAAWPEETDCDRLDRVEATLRDRGILLWQVSPCCDTCTVSELRGRIDEINDRHPGFCDCIRGYAFFIDQNMPEALSESRELSVYLGYGWLSPDNSEVPPAVYKWNALSIASEVSECLREEGFEVDWDGDIDHKIGLCINWQRRDMLR